MSIEAIETQIRISNPTGLHARPAVKLAQIAASFAAQVQVRVDAEGAWVKANSTAKIMKLKARADSTLYFRAEGEQAAAAVAALVDFVKRDFDEDTDEAVLQIAKTTTAVQTPYKLDFSTSAQQVLNATIAAPGLGQGSLYRLDESFEANYQSGDAAHEQRFFRQAIDQALEQLTALTQATADEVLGAEIIAFQQQLLQDADFLAPVWHDITVGVAAPTAWLRVLNAEIATYQAADDEYFRSRSVDLRDLRERVYRLLLGAQAPLLQAPPGAILISEELTPSQFLEIDWARFAGAVMRQGSISSHVAMLARARGVPFLVKLEADLATLTDATPALLVAQSEYAQGGCLLVEPDATALQWYQSAQDALQQVLARNQDFLPRPAYTADGHPIQVRINVDDPAVLAGLDPAHTDGIGLARTEFLFQNRSQLPDEQTQYEVYRQLLSWADGRSVTIRTLDAGGDKPIPGLTLAGESNPFLGLRGVRLSLAKPAVFAVQLRALARAAVHGRLKVMLPMVTLPDELKQARELLNQEVQALRAAGIEALSPALGIMVEVPAAALTIAEFEADFFSIGSNDLIQYLMAAGRDSSAVGYLHNPLNRAVLELIQRVAAHAAAVDREVSVCGEMAAQPECLAALLQAGINTLSIPPLALARIKAQLAKTRVA